MENDSKGGDAKDPKINIMACCKSLCHGRLEKVLRFEVGSYRIT
jgi:hypothetical protein